MRSLHHITWQLASRETHLTLLPQDDSQTDIRREMTEPQPVIYTRPDLTIRWEESAGCTPDVLSSSLLPTATPLPGGCQGSSLPEQKKAFDHTGHVKGLCDPGKGTWILISFFLYQFFSLSLVRRRSWNCCLLFPTMSCFTTSKMWMTSDSVGQ